MVFSHLLFLFFFLAKVNWHIRPWSHPSCLAPLCTGSPMAYVPSYPSTLCLQLEHWWHHSQQSHEFNLLPWVGVREGMVQNGRIIRKNMFYMLFCSFLHLVPCVCWRNQAVLRENCVNSMEDRVVQSWMDFWESFVSSVEELCRELPLWLENRTVSHTF